ncbi:putative membrane protein [Wickerhamomyces ciferrii]|uniref:Membrane protein n=1 Tax=Wickerhamomyces ciferrii (strain ATCC 14091 / BCRC 22168 / CBS 111 / JCM 3599 / NBRC 0793 / NRRL Y-1031 F-60-10) TaxID=1206466 RepID=K0KVG6_WICCF|nr:uncharacterized protein BN7_5499 [Wickerhamomyces ciferrii]CCH45912.1 putative membrane protein [Wickerhamomyces ciferrii]
MIEEINYNAVPGTTHLVDLEGKMNAHHSSGDSKIVLIPTPSDDYDDPLNWSPRRKWLAVFCNVVYTYGVGIPSAAIYSVLTNIAKETDITLGELNAGTGYMFLFFGLGCVIFQPIALQYGKRPVYLFSLFATCLICVWAPYSKSNGEWIGGKILQGFFGSPIESLCEITMSDLFFEHERARGMGIYALALITSNFMAPMLAGFVSDGMGWKWVMWLCSIFSAVCLVFLYFFMEETNFKRDYSQIDSGMTVLEGIGSDPESLAEDNLADGEKPAQREYKGTNTKNHHTVEVPSSNILFQPKPRKTFKDKISLTGGFKDKFLLPHYLLGPFKMARFPSVLWAGFLYGSSLVFFNLLNATESTVLSGAPYNFSAAMCGLAYISPNICCVVVFLMAGYMSDYLKVSLAKRRGGTSLPEDRLWILVVYMVLGFLACIGWGVGAHYEVHWIVLVISMGLMGGLTVFGCTAAVTYCSDCYHEMDTEAMVVVILIRNLMSFACSYGLTDWVLNMGYKNSFISAACLTLFCNATFLVIRASGPYWRNKTKAQYWKIVEHKRSVEAGI